MDQLPSTFTSCDAVSEHINKPIPANLWHYTSFEGMLGILTSRTIWATEYRFLNDREEFLHAKNLALELVEEEPEVTDAGFSAREVLRKAVAVAFNTGVLHEERLRVMVASFSENGDQLSQWRGYARNSTGVSIGLDLRLLRPPVESGTLATFAPCLYRDSDKRLLLKAIFSYCRAGLQNWWDTLVKEAVAAGRSDPAYAAELIKAHQKELHELLFQCHRDLQFDLLRVAPLLKNESFSEEQEWRLVFPIEASRLPSNYPFQFRAVRDTLVPYIAFPLLRANQDGPVQCTDLILGPGSHPSAEVSINMLFQTQKIRVLARQSKVPYRPG